MVGKQFAKLSGRKFCGFESHIFLQIWVGSSMADALDCGSRYVGSIPTPPSNYARISSGKRLVCKTNKFSSNLNMCSKFQNWNNTRDSQRLQYKQTLMECFWLTYQKANCAKSV